MMFLYSAICIATNFLLGTYLVLIFLALLAYLSVLMVSSNYEDAGDIFAIITVLQLPPNESYINYTITFNSLVSLLSLQGTKNPFFDLSPKALIQLANANSDLLILAPSLNLNPLFSVTVPLSLPAKSIRLSFPVSVSISVFLILLLCVTLIWKTACDLEEVRLALVDSVVLLLLPYSNRFMTYYVESALYSVTPDMVTPLIGSSLNSRQELYCTNRSLIISLYISTQVMSTMYSLS